MVVGGGVEDLATTGMAYDLFWSPSLIVPLKHREQSLAELSNDQCLAN